MSKSDRENYDRSKIQAIALGYDPDNEGAPVVLATGKGVIAEKIIATAKANNVPIKEDTALTQALSKVALNQEIPPELYVVIAEVLAYVYRIKQRKSAYS